MRAAHLQHGFRRPELMLPDARPAQPNAHAFGFSALIQKTDHILLVPLKIHIMAAWEIIIESRRNFLVFLPIEDVVKAMDFRVLRQLVAARFSLQDRQGQQRLKPVQTRLRKDIFSPHRALKRFDIRNIAFPRGKAAPARRFSFRHAPVRRPEIRAICRVN